MATKVESATERLAQEISDASRPEKMSAAEAREFYENLEEWIRGMIEGLEDDAKE